MFKNLQYMCVFLFLAFLLQLSIASTCSKTISQSSQDHIKHIVFLKDKIFYVPVSGRQFGVFSRGTGEIVSRYQLKDQQTILRVDKQLNQMILRKERNSVLVFRLNSLDIQKLDIEISFLHQSIVDAIQSEPNIYVMTEKDVRVYRFEQQKKGEDPKNILTSGRKLQWFKKICLQNGTSGEIILILVRVQQVCIRRISVNKKYTQKCLFNVSSEIKDIEPIGTSIVIKSQTFNYVIKENDQVYSFQGVITQFDQKFGILTTVFKTFDFQKMILINGIRVEGSNQEHQLFVLKKSDQQLDILYNGRYISSIQIQDVVNGVWFSASNGSFELLFSLGQRKLNFYKLDLQNNFIDLVWSTGKISMNDEQQQQL